MSGRSTAVCPLCGARYRTSDRYRRWIDRNWRVLTDTEAQSQPEQKWRLVDTHQIRCHRSIEKEYGKL